MGLSKPSAQHRSMTSWAPLHLGVGALYSEQNQDLRIAPLWPWTMRNHPQSNQHGRAAQCNQESTFGQLFFSTCSGRMLPYPPAIMMGLWYPRRSLPVAPGTS